MSCGRRRDRGYLLHPISVVAAEGLMGLMGEGHLGADSRTQCPLGMRALKTAVISNSILCIHRNTHKSSLQCSSNGA